LVRNEAVEASLEEGQVEELTLAVSEACANAIRHTGTRKIRLRLKREGHCVVIEIEDQGVFRDRLPVPEVEPGGRGILLMTAFATRSPSRRGLRIGR
jgi:anti-sigma regulatory factor (Ser/Thr protein kinase)